MASRNGLRSYSWREVSHLLTEEVPSTKRRLQIRVLDTVFLLPQHRSTSDKSQLHSWLYTSRKGHFVRRKLDGNGKQHSGQDTSSQRLSLQHVYERFCRIALSHPGNVCKTVAVVRRHDGSWSYILADGLKRAAQGQSDGGNSDLLRNECALQCFMQPNNGKDVQYRAIFKYLPNANKQSPQDEGDSRKFKVDLYLLENVMSVPSIRSIDSDEDVGDISKDIRIKSINSTISMAQHIGEILKQHRGEVNAEVRTSKRVILVLVADFVLDDKRQLWLCHVPKVTSINSSNIPKCKDKVAEMIRIEIELSSEELLRDASEERGKCTSPSNELTQHGPPSSPPESTCAGGKHKVKVFVNEINDDASVCGSHNLNCDKKLRGLTSVYSSQKKKLLVLVTRHLCSNRKIFQMLIRI